MFVHRHGKNGCRPLSRKVFTDRLDKAAAAAGVPTLQAYGVCIGGTLKYLLRSIPFDVVKTIGRWASNAFHGYLREHALVFAPYLQDSDALKAFTRRSLPAMPPVCG